MDVKRVIFAALLPAIFVISAFPGDRPRTQDTAPRWPPAPLNPRIRFVRTLSSGKDINSRPSPLVKWARKIIGNEEAEVSMGFPYGIATDSRGRVIVTDTGLKAVHVFDPATHAYSLIRPQKADRLVSPIGVAVDANDNIYVSDSYTGKILVFDLRGKLKYVIGQPEGLYKRPTGIAINRAAGRLYIADTLRNEIVVADLHGRELLRFGKGGEGPGEFNSPTQLCLKSGRLYVTDALNSRIQVFDLNGRYISGFGQPGRSAGDFDKPKGVALDSDGNVYVVEALHDVVQIVDHGGNLLLAFGGTGSAQGEFSLPTSIHIDSNDKIYVADSYNRRVQVFQYLKDGGANREP